MQELLSEKYLWNVVIALISVIIGIAAIVLSIYRRKQKNISLAAFGTTSLLYGLRLLTVIYLNENTSVQLQIMDYIPSFITYIIPVPFAGFILNLFGKSRGNSMKWLFSAAVAFAITGIVSDIIMTQPYFLNSINNVLVIFWAVYLVIYSFRAFRKLTREVRAVLTGFIIFGIFAVNENLVTLGLLPWSWRWEELGFLIFLGFLGYIAIKRFLGNEARLLSIEREMEIARRIQSSILPAKLPEVSGLDMKTQYIPMAQVAGDFYDMLLQDEKRLCIIIADVSGHGIGAALIASMLKVAFTSQQHVLYDPASVLAGINSALYGKLENNFISAGCLFLDTEKSEIRYAGAGHPLPVLHKRNEHKFYEFGNNGMLLGPFPEAEYENVTIKLESGDRLIMYTDGIIETANPSGAFYGDGKFRTFIEEQAMLSVDDFTDQLIGSVNKWAGKLPGESLDDDLTLIVMDKL